MNPADLVVVSHASVRPVNQLVYAELSRRGWRVALIIPDRWRDSYQPDGMRSTVLDELAPLARRLRVVMPGAPQRHFYVANSISTLRRLAPRHVLIEEEAYSLSAVQWATSAAVARIPFSLRLCENIDRPLPFPARAWTKLVLDRARWVMSCGVETRDLMDAWGAGSRATVVPFAVPEWDAHERPPTHDTFTVGFAGRLVEAKGVHDLAAAVGRMRRPASLIFIGNGPERSRLEHQPTVIVQADWDHADMHRAYAQLDVLVVPSRTTPRWKEQFGRVIVEALYCGIPVVGSDSGEIPHLIRATGGGVVFHEGDVDALAQILDELAGDPQRRHDLARAGNAVAKERYSVSAVADTIEALTLR